MIAATGIALTALGSGLLYVTSPNQRALERRPPPIPLAIAGWLLFVLGLVVLLQWAGPATAVFIWFTIASLVWTLMPPLAAWLRQTGKGAK